MLQTLRGTVGSFVVKVLFILLMATFALLGVGYGVRDLVLGRGSSNDAATVGDIKIGLQQFDRTYRRYVEAEQRQHPTEPLTPAQRQEVAHKALDQEVDDALYASAAKDSGILVGNDQVKQWAAQQAPFRDAQGQFDRARLELFLRNQQLSEAGFAALVRGDVARRLVLAPVAAGAIAPKMLVEDLYRYRNEQRVAETVTLPNSGATGIPAPTDDQLKAYYDKHAVDYTLPEYRNFTVLVLSPDLFTGEITPSDEDLHAAYDAHHADFAEPEKRKIEQVVLDKKESAEAVQKAANVGKSLLDAAKAAGVKAEVNELGFITKDAFPSEFSDPVFAAAKGAIVGPIETSVGWHIVHVEEVQPGREVPFDEAKPKLVTDVKRERAIDRLAGEIDKIGDQLNGGTPLEQIASGLGATPVKVGPVDAKGKPAAGAADSKPGPAWTRKAFALQAHETTPFEDSGDGGYFAVRLDSVTPPALRPLADVRADVTTAWTNEQRKEATAKQAQTLADVVRGGKSMADIAKQTGGKIETSPPMTRDDAEKEPGTGPLPDLVSALFNLSKVSEVATVATPDGQMIARLSEIRAADPKANQTALTPLKTELDTGLERDSVEQYRTLLHDRYKVDISPKAIDTVAGP